MTRLVLVVALLLALPASANKNLQTKQGAHLNTAGGGVVFSALTGTIETADSCTGTLTGVTTSRTASGYCVKTDGTMTLLGANTSRVESAGLLVEPQAQNVLLQSEAIDNAAHTKTNVTVPATDSSAPMGNVAETLLATAGSVRHNIAQAYTATAVDWTCSAIVKKPVGSVDFAWLSINNGTNYTHFNLSTGAKATEGAGNTGAITALSNGYYRIAVTRTMGAGATSVHLGLSNADAAATFNAAGTETLLATAMQCEIGSVATSYIPTLGTAVTRTADGPPQITGGIVLGTTVCFAADAKWRTLGTNLHAVEFRMNGSERWSIYSQGGGNNVRLERNGSPAISIAGLVANQSHRVRAYYDGAAWGLCLDGSCSTSAVPTAPAAGTWPVYVGSFSASTLELNGWLKNICIGKTAGACP